MKLIKGDLVLILSGKDKSKKGKILAVFPKKGKVVVEGVNMLKRHLKSRQGQTGGIISKEYPVSVSKCMLINPETNKPTRVGYQIDKGGHKYRLAKDSGKMLTSTPAVKVK